MGTDLEVLEKAADEEIARLQEELIPEEEFQKLKNSIEVSMIGRLSGIESRAELLATAYTYYKSTATVNTEINRFLAVTREDIRNAARKYFRRDNRVVLYYLPKTN